jgi:hypothetical protein
MTHVSRARAEHKKEQELAEVPSLRVVAEFAEPFTFVWQSGCVDLRVHL